jgi:hypothetical protein
MSLKETIKEIRKHTDQVRSLMYLMANLIKARGNEHDLSKFEEPELSTYDKYIPELKKAEYGSDEYKRILSAMGLALRHHYDKNSHHPEHFQNGIDGMSLFDVIEMLSDWVVSSQSKNNEVLETLKLQKDRFNLSDQLYKILRNTVIELDKHL